MCKTKEKIRNKHERKLGGIMKIHEFVEKQDLIQEFAEEIARLQMKADKYYYIDRNKEMSDFILIYAFELKVMASRLGICNEMQTRAREIYDYSHSGEKDYIPSQEQIDRLKRFGRRCNNVL